VVDTVTNRQKLDIATLPYELGIHPSDARSAMVACLTHQTLDSRLSTLVHNTCNLFDLSTSEGFDTSPNSTCESDGMDGVTDYQLTWHKAFGVQAVHFISGKTRHDCHC
jgi:hypothetical protein